MHGVRAPTLVEQARRSTKHRSPDHQLIGLNRPDMANRATISCLKSLRRRQDITAMRVCYPTNRDPLRENELVGTQAPYTPLLARRHKTTGSKSAAGRPKRQPPSTQVRVSLIGCIEQRCRFSPYKARQIAAAQSARRSACLNHREISQHRVVPACVFINRSAL